MWIRRGLLPHADPTTGGWTKAALDEAVECIVRDGIQNDNPGRRHSHFVKIYNAQRLWKKLEQGEGAGHWLFYFRPTSERLPGSWGSPEFMAPSLPPSAATRPTKRHGGRRHHRHRRPRIGPSSPRTVT